MSRLLSFVVGVIVDADVVLKTSTGRLSWLRASKTLRKLSPALFLILAAPIGHANDARSRPTVVYPTGVYPADVINAQAAVNQGGTVLLKATNESGVPTAFNFGPAAPGSGALIIVNDVSVLGESWRGKMTTIQGGSTPIRVLAPVRSRIEGLHLQAPRSNGIVVAASADLSIIDNVITDVSGVDDGSGITFARGIYITAGGAPLTSISGAIVIAKNRIDGIHAQLSYGISVSNFSATLLITKNRVSNVNLNGILVGVNTNRASIVDNVVIPGAGEYPDVTAGNGIFVGHPAGGLYYIAGNRVVCDNPFADGITLVGNSGLNVVGSTVRNNKVSMHGSFYGAISLYDSVSSVTIERNEIRGNGAYALQVGLYATATPLSAVGNTFASNDVEDFNASASDVFLDINASNTVLCRQPGSVDDQGSATTSVADCGLGSWRHD